MLIYSLTFRLDGKLFSIAEAKKTAYTLKSGLIKINEKRFTAANFPSMKTKIYQAK